MARGYFSGGLTESQHYLAAIGAGKVPRLTPVNWLARRVNVSTSGKADLFDYTDNYIFPPDDGEEMTVESNDASDAGKIIFILGLDEDKLEKTQFFALDTMPISIGKWSRINETVSAFGSLNGTITTQGTNVYSVLLAADGRSFSGVYSSPVDKRLQLLSVYAGISCLSSGADATVCGELMAKPANQIPAEFVTAFPFGLRVDGTSSTTIPNTVPTSINGSVDLKVHAESSNTGVQVDLRMAMILEELTPLEKNNLFGG